MSFIISPKQPLGSYKKIFLARATKEEIRRRRVGSGGAVTSICIFLLEKNLADGIVAARRVKGFEGKVVVARTREEVLEAAGTKWYLIPFTGRLRDAIEHYGLKRVAIVALPCQAQFLNQLREFPLLEVDFSERIYLIISLFCLGTFAHEAFASYLRTLNIDPSRVVDMKLVGEELVVAMEDGSERRIRVKDALPLLQVGCLVCPDYTGVWADVSAGISEQYLGWTVLIARTELGLSIVEQAADAGYIELQDAPSSVVEEVSLKAQVKIARASKYATRLL